ncbi:TauD/TfdA family dioxygenase [Streptomyces sp. NPDC059209]|uniref:TauD/TfdA family dioxygenase n=1 Tax=Streptomyces sp. NPDC059209 TaxID=3346769 RepID=UPI003692D3D6
MHTPEQAGSTAVDWRPKVISPEDRAVSPTADGLTEVLGDGGPVAELLAEHAALVLRGFGITPKTLERVMPLLLADRLAYVHGNSPRTKVGQNVYTSTEYPRELTISMHSEMSYAARWPARLLFFCQQAAGTGGATPVVDTSLWYRSLDPVVREAFADGLRYTQNLHGGRGFGKSWQETFETEDRDEVDRYLGSAGTDWEWKAGGGLRVTQVRPAVVEDPATGSTLWFNQADQWHPAALGDEAGAALLRTLPQTDLPQSVTFADGSPIPAEYVLQIRDRGLACAIDVDWRTGDLLLIDNVRVAHGRRPFTGSRRVLVAMSD